MRTDIVVVGGGLAGSLAAAMLGRAGRDVVLIDPHEQYPPDFRCEKLEQGHIEVLRRTGLADAVLRAATPSDRLWVARFGRLVDKMPFQQYGLSYEQLVGAVRAEIPARVPHVLSWADEIVTSHDRQQLRLANGKQVDARLVVLASGKNWALREALGVERVLASSCHSITVGFDLASTEPGGFPFPALQYNAEAVGKGVGYLTLFRIAGSMRANLFLYQPLKSPWLADFRRRPDEALAELLPRLSTIAGRYRVEGPIKVRPTDLHVARNVDRPGVVMIGDAFTAPCPATGTGALKVFNDVERLCNHHIPQWFATAGMGPEKISAFYADPAKLALDGFSVSRAYNLRALSVETGPYWSMQRGLRYVARRARWALREASGQVRRVAGQVAPTSPVLGIAPAEPVGLVALDSAASPTTSAQES